MQKTYILRYRREIMKREINLGVFIIVLLPLVSVFSIEDSNEFPITIDPGSQHDPAIYGDIVVWADKRNGNWDIYGYDLSTGQEFQITTDPDSQSNPAIYEDIVVWTDHRNDNYDIYGYNLSTGQEFQITTDPYWQSGPAIYEDIVVWEDHRNDNGDIYGYNLSTNKEFQITTDPDDQEYPAIYNDIVVWESRGDYIGFTVHGVNISTGEIFQVPKIRRSFFRPLYLQGDPAVFEDVVIWVEAGKDTIYGYNLLTKEKVIIAAAHEREQGPGTYRVNTTPAIYEDIVVWEDNRNGNYDIYGYNLATGQQFQVTTHEANQHSSAIYEHIVVWQDIRNGNYDIYGCTITALVTTPEPNSVISLEVLCGIIIIVIIIAVLIKKRS
jgi:beta propeller repeat protein